MRLGHCALTTCCCLLASRPPSRPIIAMSAGVVAPAADEAAAIKSAAAANEPFSDAELDAAMNSLRRLAPDSSVDWQALRALYAERAHLKHKDWAQTIASAERLEKILGGPGDADFRKIFGRVLDGGNWDAAASVANARATDPGRSPPWIVLVTGLNGIRKTTSVHQPWFKDLLRQALGSAYDPEEPKDFLLEDYLPAGSDSFFRQLDFMICTLALEQFERLYALDDVGAYAQFKEAIFARYRTIAEMLGVLLVRAAQKRGLNVMVETSGRDVGMYEYIEALFPDDGSLPIPYRMLVVNFAINDISFAERSVDARMLSEMAVGRAALAKAEAEPEGVVAANAGGPYGSAVLAGVQADSERVWKQIAAATAEGEVGFGWYKAAIAIDADESAPWQARPLPPGGAEATATATTAFAFGAPPKA